MLAASQVEAMTAPLPENWTEHNTKDGQPYYYNKSTDTTQWEHPMDDWHRKEFQRKKKEKMETFEKVAGAPTASPQVLCVSCVHK